MSIRKIRNTWWVDFRAERTRHRLRSPDNSKRGAEAYEALLRQRLARGKEINPAILAPRVEQDFASFSQEWMKTYVRTNNKPSEQRTKELILKNHLIPFFGRLALNEIGATQIEKFKEQKIREKYSPKTINNHLTVLSKCLRTACDWGRFDHPPAIKLLKAVSQRLEFLLPPESELLIRKSNYPMWSEMAFLALRTGMRLGELIGLEWQDVDFSRKQLTVQRSVVRGISGTPKNGRIRHIPLTDDVCRSLYDLRKQNGIVFSRKDGSSLGYSMASNAIRKMCKRAGIRIIGWHVLRHTFASQLASQSVPLPAIKELLGHSTIAMTMRYAHLAPSALREAVSVLERPLAPILPDFGQQVVNTDELISKIVL